MHLHNPFGQRHPMAWNQIPRLIAEAEASPGNADLQAQADVDAFVEGMSQLGALGIYRSVYTGQVVEFLHTSYLEGDTPQTWANRRLEEVEPFLQCVNVLHCDALMGERPSWPAWAIGNQGGVNLVAQGVRDRQIIFGQEPFGYLETEWTYDNAKFIVHLTDLQESGDGSGIANRWEEFGTSATTWPMGRPVDEGQTVQAPGVNGELVFIWCPFKDSTSPTGGNWTNEQKFEHIQYLNSILPNCKICIPFGLIPFDELGIDI